MALTYPEEILAARAMDAPLDVRLAHAREACARLLPEYSAAIDGFVARLREAGAGAGAPMPGEIFPDFVMPDQSGRLRRLSDLLADGPLVIAFHRGLWCSFCRVSLAALAESQPRLAAHGARLAAISPQRAAWGARHLADAGADFPMLCDIGSAFAASIGLAVHVDRLVRQLLESFGINMADANGDEGAIVPIPACFVLAADGRVLARHVEADFRHRMNLEAMLQALDAAADPEGASPPPAGAAGASADDGSPGAPAV